MFMNKYVYEYVYEYVCKIIVCKKHWLISIYCMKICTKITEIKKYRIRKIRKLWKLWKLSSNKRSTFQKYTNLSCYDVMSYCWNLNKCETKRSQLRLLLVMGLEARRHEKFVVIFVFLVLASTYNNYYHLML